MTIGQINAICWTVFIAGCVLLAPVLLVAIATHAVILIALYAVLWWAPFVYGMYLELAVVRNGDRRLLRRGVSGTAAVLSAKATNEVIQEGEFAWEAPRVYKYKLLVSLPGKEPYQTSCRICAAGIRAGQTVTVVAARHNHKRVTIDVGQGQPGGQRRPAPVAAPVVASSVAGPGRVSGSRTGRVSGFAGSGVGLTVPSTESERLSTLEQLGRLHQQGVLTDAEFAEQKARILSE
jgi:hypothetical protein